MTMPQIEPVTKLSRDYKTIFAKLSNGPVFLAQRSKPAAVLLSVQEYEALLSQIQPAEDVARADALSDEQQMAQEEAAFSQALPKLRESYLDIFVAFYQEKLIDHDTDELALLARIDQQYPDQVVLIKPVMSEPEPVLRIRSPRLV